MSGGVDVGSAALWGCLGKSRRGSVKEGEEVLGCVAVRAKESPAETSTYRSGLDKSCTHACVSVHADETGVISVGPVVIADVDTCIW